MKISTAILSSLITLSGNALSQNIEFYYTLSSGSIKSLNDTNSPTINIGPTTVQPNTEKGWFFANNIANSSQTFQSISATYNGGAFTGLTTQDQPGLVSQKVLTPNNGSVNLFQSYNGAVGMMLSTWGITRPNAGIHSSSLQFVKSFENSINKPSPWENNSSSLLCTNAIIDMHSWYGSQVQAMFTMQFRQKNAPQKWFFLNAMILDTNNANPLGDSIITDNPNDTGMPIALTFLQSNGGTNAAIKYSSPIPNYGAQLGAYTKQFNRQPSSNDQHYGFCISKQQFQTLLNDINSTHPNLNASTMPENWNLGVTLISPEIAGEGDLGMSIKAMNVYRLYN